MFTEKSLTAFGRVVASEAPAPGGGSVSALAGGLAAGLAAMAARLTLKKAAFADVHPLMADVCREADDLQEQLVAAVDRDADSFRQVMAAYRMPQSGETEKTARSAAIQAALRHAAEVPLEVAEWSARAMALAGTVAAKGNPDMATDAGVGILMARAAALGALMNVEINLAGLKDPALVDAMREKAEALKQTVLQREKGLLTALG